MLPKQPKPPARQKVPARPKVRASWQAAVLPEHDLVTEAAYERLDYRDADLTGRSAESVSLAQCRFNGADLSGTVLDRARLTDCLFDSSNLANVRASGSALIRVHLSLSRMTGFTWVDSLARDVTFDECRMDLSGWRFSRFHTVVFNRCNLRRADFTGADLTGARFAGCDLTGAQFSNAKMAGARIAGCVLVDVAGITSWAGAVVQGQDLVALSYTLAAALGIHIDKVEGWDAYSHGFFRPQPHLDPLLHRVPQGHVGERLDLEVRPQLPVDDAQHVAVELRGHAGRVVVGRHENGGILDQIGAQQQPLPRLQWRAQGRQERRPLAGQQVADGPAEERDHPGAAARQEPEVAGEVADHAVHVQRRVVGRDGGDRLAQRRLRNVQRDERAQRAMRPQRVEQQAGLLRRARAQLDQRLRPGDPGDVAGPAHQHRVLGARRVVLRKLRDPLEQPAAPLVVEPLARKPFRGGSQPGEHVGTKRPRQVAGVEMDFKLGYPHSAPSFAVSTVDLVAVTSWPSGTGCHWVTSSSGSELSSTCAAPWRIESAWPSAVATTVSPSVSSTFSRDPGAAVATSTTVSATALPGDAPSRSRSRTSAHNSAESVGASRVTRSVTGSRSASPATESGQPTTSPLWLNNHRSSVNGGVAVSTTGMRAVADRTAARIAPAIVTAASAGRSGSVHIGRARRYRTGVVAPSGYQPTPKPSALMVPPPRMSFGAHDWCTRACGGSNSKRDNGIGGPR